MTAAIDRTLKPIAPLPKLVSFEQFIDWFQTTQSIATSYAVASSFKYRDLADNIRS